MSADRSAKREDLRSRLLVAAQARIESGGLKTLRARDLTADAGCALGGLYNAFADLDDLVLHVNSRTLARLSAALELGLAGIADPAARLKALARTYLGFARDNYTLWSALFDYRMPAGAEVPEWHRAELMALFQWIVEPLGALRPDLADEALQLRSRTLFAAVHGIVAISLEDRFVGLSRVALAAELDSFLDIHIAGLMHGAHAA